VLKRFRHDKKARHSAICERAMEALHGRRLAHV
jgi:hypothetical protein